MDSNNFLVSLSKIYSGVVVTATTTISQPPRDMVVMVNQTTFLFCGASYSPAIDITYDWWHNTYKVMFVKVRNLGNSVYVYKEPHYTRVSGGSTEPPVLMLLFILMWYDTGIFVSSVVKDFYRCTLLVLLI